MSNKKRKKKFVYPNGGDGLFFYHKKTKHPAKQLSHSDKTWTNQRYTHSPNNLKNYRVDEDLSTLDEIIYYQKTIFIDSIYTRGRPYSFKKKKHWFPMLCADRRTNVQTLNA